MAEIDLLSNLLSSNPNEPASKGEVLLLRAEMKYEFKTLRLGLDQKFAGLDQRFAQIDQRFDRNEGLLRELVRMAKATAEQVAILVERSSGPRV